MHIHLNEIKIFSSSWFGLDFYIDIFSFKNKPNDRSQKKTENRLELRRALYQYLEVEKQYVFEDLLDLRIVPQLIAIDKKNYFSSLSHTEDIGVFVFGSCPIGVDLENRERISADVVARVCEPTELALTADHALLWSIKEASFKSIPFIDQPKLISKIKILKLSPLTDLKISNCTGQTFTAKDEASLFQVQGIIISNNTHLLAIAQSSELEPST